MVMRRLRQAPLVAVLVAIAVLATACGQEARERGSSSDPVDDAAIAIEVHRSPLCGCCGDYEEYLEGNGFEVTSVERDDVEVLKRELGMPQEMGSCHTSLVEGYFVEGHVPVEAIRELLAERPDIDGISLPGMPEGSPGMGGTKSEPWVIYAIDDGEVEEFATL
jgi:hypothetical protein